MSTQTILVTGATGKQGRAVITALLASPTPYSILALTRSLTSPSAKSLAASSPNISLLQGDLNDIPALFAQLPRDLFGVFSVQIALQNPNEEKQGKELIDAAAAHGVKHFVYSSVDRGGKDKSDNNPTPIPTFGTKMRVEQHLEASNLQWTILRPTGFMDNFHPDFEGKGMVAMWKLNKPESRMQMVACRDIGRMAALAFSNPEEWTEKKISLAGDDLTWAEMNQVFKNVYGTDIPNTFSFVGRALRWVLYDLLGRMFEWLETDGWNADVEECRRVLPGMLSFEDWLREESAFRK